jgi:hypothetical protein
VSLAAPTVADITSRLIVLVIVDIAMTLAGSLAAPAPTEDVQ